MLPNGGGAAVWLGWDASICKAEPQDGNEVKRREEEKVRGER